MGVGLGLGSFCWFWVDKVVIRLFIFNKERVIDIPVSNNVL